MGYVNLLEGIGLVSKNPISSRWSCAVPFATQQGGWFPVENNNETVFVAFFFFTGFSGSFSRWWFFEYFLFVHPENWGRWTHFDEHIFQMGWFKPPTSSEWHSVCHLPGVVIQISKVAPKSSWNFRRTRPIRTFWSTWRCWLKSPDFLKGIHLTMKENFWVVAKKFKHAWIAFLESWLLLLRHFCRFGVGLTVVVFLDVFNFSPLSMGNDSRLTYICVSKWIVPTATGRNDLF